MVWEYGRGLPEVQAAVTELVVCFRVMFGALAAACMR